jgi:hypothetical protein
MGSARTTASATVGTGRGNRDLVINDRRIASDLARLDQHSSHVAAAGRGLWQGSRVERRFETEARRRGALLAADAVLSPLSR